MLIVLFSSSLSALIYVSGTDGAFEISITEDLFISLLLSLPFSLTDFASVSLDSHAFRIVMLLEN